MTARPASAATVSERVRELAPAISARARDAELLRRVPDETVAEFRDAGILDTFRPARYGGPKSDVSDFMSAVRIAGHACGSTGWVLAVLAVHSWHVAQFPQQAQDDMWADDPDALASSAYAPTGSVRAVEGGYVLSGRWPFSSGCDHATWAILGGGAPRPDGPPDPRTFLVPRTDYLIDDTWHVAGLAATGSKDIVIDEAFVPEHRSHRFEDAFRGTSPGLSVNTEAIYGLPFGTLFAIAIAYPIFGMARRAVDEYFSVLQTKVGAYDHAQVLLDPVARETYARAVQMVDAIDLSIDNDIMSLASAAADGSIPLDLRANIRYRSASAVQQAARAADLVFSAAGGRSIFLDAPIQRAWRDARAGAVHAVHNEHKAAQTLSSVRLGLPPADFLF